MDTNEENKKRFRHPDRVTLNTQCLEKIAGWHTQLSDQIRGLSVTKSNLVEWLIETHKESLTASECGQIKEKFFDDVRYHEWAMREYKKQKRNGLTISFSQFLADNLKAPSSNQERKKQPRGKMRADAVGSASTNIGSSSPP